MNSLDKIDNQILEMLFIDGRVSASFISEKIGLSIPTVTDRIKKMLEADIISGFQAVINYKKLGYEVSALITLMSDSSLNFSEIVNRSKEMPEVVKCFATTGTGSHVMLVNTENTDSLEKMLCVGSAKYVF